MSIDFVLVLVLHCCQNDGVDPEIVAQELLVSGELRKRSIMLCKLHMNVSIFAVHTGTCNQQCRERCVVLR